MRAIQFLREQYAAMLFTKAVAVCRTEGRHYFETIMWRGELCRCCIRCGKDE